MKRGEEVEVRVTRLAGKGQSSGELEGRDVLVTGAVPGDLVRARLRSKRKGRWDALLVEVLEPSPNRVDPRCPHFGPCGGCRWQHLSYPGQLEAKRALVQDAFLDHGVSLDHLEIPSPLGADPIWRYRNKMEFSFGDRRWLTTEEVSSDAPLEREFGLGLFVPGRHDRVLDLRECHITTELAEAVLCHLRGLAKAEGWTPWSPQRQEGYLRHLVVRTPAHTDEVLLNLVTSEYESERIERFANLLRAELPAVTTLVNTINRGVAQVSTGEETHVLFGSGVIHDRIGPYTFEIGAASFFQTNTLQAETLYDVVREFAAAREDTVLYDLFCGVGTISLYLARDVRTVVGLEVDAGAVTAAVKNAEQNGVDNVHFLAGDLRQTFVRDLFDGHGRPDVVIADPPRAGIHPDVIARIVRWHPPRLVYVSCNPKTQARDIAMLLPSYDVEAIQPVDLFPHTDHIENVAVLRSKRA